MFHNNLFFKIMNITVKELIEMLQVEDPNLIVDFNGLQFYRLKDRGGSLQFEFNQTVYLDDEGYVVVEDHSLPKRDKPE